jgi:hypothetical protein
VLYRPRRKILLEYRSRYAKDGHLFALFWLKSVSQSWEFSLLGNHHIRLSSSILSFYWAAAFWVSVFFRVGFPLLFMLAD